MNSVYFENVVQIGNLYLDHVFYEFESEPILFTCVDDVERLYLCFCSDIRYGQKWIIAECSLEMLRALILEKKDIATIFLSSCRLTGVWMDLQGKEESCQIDRKSLDRLDLPEEGIYLRCDREKADNYLWRKELQVAIALHRTDSDRNPMREGMIEISYVVNIDMTITVESVSDSYKDSFERLRTYGEMLNEYRKEKVTEQKIYVMRNEDYLKITGKTEINIFYENDYLQAA